MTYVKRARSFLFDMDGTLLDSSAATARTWEAFSRRHGLSPAEVNHFAHGRRTLETVQRFLADESSWSSETARIVREDIDDVRGIRAVVGARQVLEEIGEKNWAVVTSANRDLAIARMRAAGLPVPSVLVTAEDIRFGKPHPEGYLSAARRLGVAAAHCVAFEDAPAGLEAAAAARASVVVVGDAEIKTRVVARIVDFSQISVTKVGDAGFDVWVDEA